MKINDHEVNMREVASGLAVMGLIAVAVVFLGWFWSALDGQESRQQEQHALLVAQAEIAALPVTITPWSPGTAENPSPYVCFLAMKRTTVLVDMSCLDTSLTVLP